MFSFLKFYLDLSTQEVKENIILKQQSLMGSYEVF
jgi:hypothetical protein